MSRPVDLDSCAAEPIRIPGAIQPFGALLVVDCETLQCLHASANFTMITGALARPGEPVGAASEELRALVADIAHSATGPVVSLRRATLNGVSYQAHGHITSQGLILELEPADDRRQRLEALYPRLGAFLDAIGQAADLEAMGKLAAAEIRSLTGFNRVLLYTFGDNGDGTVLAEDGDGVLPSYMGFRFPGSDIPAQARELYRLNRLRLIPDANYTPCPVLPPISPRDGRPLDLSHSALRSVSPIHLEYMRNMGTGASMSISLVVDGELWGLISAHNRDPQRVSAPVRAVCASLGQVLSLQIEARQRAQQWNERLRFKDIETRLLTALAMAPSFQQGLVANQNEWMALTGARGAAVVTGGDVLCAGETPPKPLIQNIARDLHARGVETFSTDSVVEIWPDARAVADVASGLIAISISQLHPDFVLWFRPEWIRHITWSGDPSKPVDATAKDLHPRRSFEAWRQQVRLRSLAWSKAEIESANNFRRSMQDLVLRRAEERAALVERLEIANRELESFSYSVSHDLRAPFRHIVGFSDLLAAREPDLDGTSRRYIATVREAALSAGRLVDGLLNFSQLGRASLNFGVIDMDKLALEVRRSLETEISGRSVKWRLNPLPRAWGDATMIRQVLQNLVENALKYSRTREQTIIEIDSTESHDTITYAVSDNGVGFEMKYADKLFGVFQRLHRSEEFEGTGIGLALVKRIVERHGGAVTACGELEKGARFTFSLQQPPRNDRARDG